MRKTTTTLGLAALLIAAPAVGQIYKCTDPATGKTTYSQTQCATNAAPADIHVATPSEAEQRRAILRAEQMKADAESMRRQREIKQAERELAEIRAQTARDLARANELRAESLEARRDLLESRPERRPPRRPPRPPRP